MCGQNDTCRGHPSSSQSSVEQSGHLHLDKHIQYVYIEFHQLTEHLYQYLHSTNQYRNLGQAHTRARQGSNMLVLSDSDSV